MRSLFLSSLFIGAVFLPLAPSCYSQGSPGSPALSPFIKFQGNPIISPGGSETLTAFGSFLKSGSTYHAYYMYNVSSVPSIGHATSTDGMNWSKDSANNPVLTAAGGSAWDGTGVGVPTVWIEGSTWYMLYRGIGTFDGNYRGGLATSSNGLTWTRSAVNNCASETGNGCVLDIGFVSGGTETIEPYGIIKVGSTYYLNIDQPGGLSRATGSATSTNLTTWTKDAANPIFTGGRYCAGIFKNGSQYYQLVAHYTGSAITYSEIEMYQSSSPVFYPSSRTFLGVAVQPSGASADTFGLDTPFVLTDDITRSTFAASNGNLWLYYSGSQSAQHVNFYTSLAISSAGGMAWAQPDASILPGGAIVIGTANVTGDVQAGGTNGFWLNNPAAFFFWYQGSQITQPADGTVLVQNHSGVTGTWEGHYKSSDGTAGFTGTCTLASITSITVKDGLVVSCQ